MARYKVLTWKIKGWKQGWKLDTPLPLHEHITETTQNTFCYQFSTD